MSNKSVISSAKTEIDRILGLNRQQKDAALFSGNTIVSAGAGCGKTQTMVGRIVYKILEGVPLSEMLIITFTRAAAASLKKKMSDAFSAIHNSDKIDSSVKTMFDEAAYSMPVSDIGTIHSFCQRLRTRFPIEGIDPTRTICDEQDSAAIKSSAVKAAIKEGMSDEKFVDICKMLSDRRTDNGAEKAIGKIVDYALTLSDPEKFFGKIKKDEDYFERAESTVPEKNGLSARIDAIYKSVIEEELDDLLDVSGLKNYFDCVDGAVRPSLPGNKKPKDKSKHAVYDLLKSDFSLIRDDCDEYLKVAWAEKNNSVPYATALMEVACSAYEKYKKKKADRGVIDYSDLEHDAITILSNEKYRTDITSHIKCVFIDEYQDVNPLQNQIAETFRNAGANVFLVGDIKQSIYGFRRCNPRFFSDTLSTAYEKTDPDRLNDNNYTRFDLTGNYRSSPEVIKFVNDVFSEIMTSELGGVNYDVSHALEAMGENKNVVGRAEFVYIDKDAAITVKSDIVPVEPTDSYSDTQSGLAEKTETEVAPVEELCKNPDEEDVCKNPDFETVAGAKEKTERCDNPVDEVTEKAEADKCEKKYKKGKGKEKKEEKPKEPYSVKNAASSPSLDPEACYIANRILALTAKNEKGESEAKFGDITILLRSTDNAFAATLFDTLGYFDIPVSIGRSAKIREFPEAVALLDIARFVDTAVDDLALYTALRSSMGGFNDEELAEIATEGGAAFEKSKIKKRRDITFVDKVKAYIKSSENKHIHVEIIKRLKEFFSLRDKFRTYSACHDAADTLGYITSEIDYFTHVYSTCGAHAASSVEALISSAVDKKCDLHTFIEYCSDPDFELSASSVGDTVKIETIHKSKGLEYKYCFVAGCAKGFNFSDINNYVIIDDDGIAVKVPCSDGLVGETIPHLLAKEDEKKKLISEELRMLYVALTRAEKALIVTAKTRAKENKDPAKNPNGYIDFLKQVPFLKSIIDAPLTEVVVNGRSYDNDENEAVTQAVIERFKFVYPEKNTFVKMSVTAVAEESDEYKTAKIADDGERVDEYSVKRRSGKKRDGGETARLKGTAYHKAMELIDFENPDFDKIRGSIENVELIEEDERGVENIIKAVNEIKNTIKGVRYIKEQHFIADIKVVVGNIKKETQALKIIKERIDLSDSSASSDEEVALVQGIIDLIAVHDDGEVTIVDYKTTKEDGLNSDAYETQLALYKSAVEVSTGKAVKRAVLYSFEKGFIPPVEEW